MSVSTLSRFQQVSRQKICSRANLCDRFAPCACSPCLKQCAPSNFSSTETSIFRHGQHLVLLLNGTRNAIRVGCLVSTSHVRPSSFKLFFQKSALTDAHSSVLDFVQDSLPLNFTSRIEGDRWSGSADIPANYFPPRVRSVVKSLVADQCLQFCLPLETKTTQFTPKDTNSQVTKFNAYAIHGSGDERMYEALYPTPEGKYENPDL